MRILRPFFLGGITLLSTVAICFVAADRIAHTSFRAPATATIARMDVPVQEPQTTGTVVQGLETPEPKAASLDGFDTERLNALMRGEVLPAPAAKPKPKATASAARR